MRGIRSGALSIAVAASVFVALGAAAARADVDVEVPLALKAKGTMIGETEVYRFWAARGTVVSMKFAVAGKSALTELVAQLHDFDNDLVPFPSDTVEDGKKIQFKTLELPFSGWYRLELYADGVGDYTLDLKGKARTLWTGESDLTAGNVGIDFAAPRGATALLLAKAKKGSVVTPRWDDVTAAGYAANLAAVGKATVTSHTAPAGPFPEGGEVDAALFQADGAGFVQWQIKVKAPKVKPKKLDLTAKALGRPAGAETMFLRGMDGSGGVVQVFEDGGSDLYGASVTIPEGALDGPVDISIASTIAPTPPDVDDQAAGPAVDLGPGGIVFDGDVTVTLPYDDALLPVGAVPDDLRVLVVEEDGTSQVVIPDSFDTENDTVTLTTDTLSVCMPIVRSGLPRLGLDPDGDEYWLLQLDAELVPGGGNDSRARRAATGIGQVTFHGDNSFEYSVHRREHSWTNVDTGVNPPIDADLQYSVTNDSDGGGATWAYGGDGQTITLPGQEPVFRPSRDGSVIVGRREDADDTGAEVQLLVRKNARPLTLASLYGTWHFEMWAIIALEDPRTGAAVSMPDRVFGTFAFDGVGGCRIAVQERVAYLNIYTGAYITLSGRATAKTATYFVDQLNVPGTIVVVVPPGVLGDEGKEFRFYPGVGLETMVGSDRYDGATSRAFVLVRQGSGMGTGSLDGDWHGVEYGMDPFVYSPGDGVNILDFHLESDVTKPEFHGGSSASFPFFGHSVQRDTNETGGIRVEDSGLVTPSGTASVGVSVTSLGKVAFAGENGKFLGAVAPSGQFVVYVTNPSSSHESFDIGFVVRAPAPPPE